MFPRGQWDLAIAWRGDRREKGKGEKEKRRSKRKERKRRKEGKKKEMGEGGEIKKNQKRRSSWLGRKEFC